MNFYAQDAYFDGSTHANGGVFGSGSYGTLNVDVSGTLTIDGNISGSYGTVKNIADKAFTMNIKASSLVMKGDLMTGSQGEGYSDTDRKTNITLDVQSAQIDGNIKAYQGSDSLFMGNITVSDTLVATNDAKVSLGNGASLEVNEIVADQNSIISLGENSTAKFTSNSSIANLTSKEGGTLYVAGDAKGTIGSAEGLLNIKVDEAESGKVKITNSIGTVTTLGSASYNDGNLNSEFALNALIDTVEGSDAVSVEEGAVNGAASAVISEDGKLSNVQISKNSKLDAFASVAVLNAVAWRHELNSVSKRMGELRDAPEGVGAWARLYGSEMEYGDQSVKSQNTTIQIGSDYKVGQWTLGATVGYTDGDSDYDRGSSDNEAWNFGVYGTWFADNGQYVDLIAKYSRLSQDFKLDTMTGDYDNNAFVVSAEYGWHLPVMELGFIEPQIELTYGRIMGKDFTTGNGVEIKQDDFDSLIGRLGVRAGIKCPDNWGTVYARASVVHDFDGEFNATAHSLTGTAVVDIFEDLGGTWGEFGIGANINFTKNTYMYVDAEITSGGEVDENYRWNIGVRHNF